MAEIKERAKELRDDMKEDFNHMVGSDSNDHLTQDEVTTAYDGDIPAQQSDYRDSIGHKTDYTQAHASQEGAHARNEYNHGHSHVDELESEFPAKDAWIAEEVKDHDESNINPHDLSISQIDEMDALRDAESDDHNDQNQW